MDMTRMMAMGLAALCCAVAGADTAPLPRQGRSDRAVTEMPPRTVSVAGDTERFIGLGPSCRVKEGELAPGQSHELAFQVKVEARN